MQCSWNHHLRAAMNLSAHCPTWPAAPTTCARKSNARDHDYLTEFWLQCLLSPVFRCRRECIFNLRKAHVKQINVQRPAWWQTRFNSAFHRTVMLGKILWSFEMSLKISAVLSMPTKKTVSACVSFWFATFSVVSFGGLSP